MTMAEVAGITTWNTRCGIASYSEDLHAALVRHGIRVQPVPIEREQLAFLSLPELRRHFDNLVDQAADSPVVLLQHDFGFYAGRYSLLDSIRTFGRMLRRVRRRRRRIVVTFHTLPPLPNRTFRVDRAWLRDAAVRTAWRRSVLPHFRGGRATAVAPSRYLRWGLVESGMDPAAIHVIPQGFPAPLPAIADPLARQGLGYSSRDRVLVMFGFVGAYKGHLVALEALRSLPESYHLAIVGGSHPMNGDPALERALRYVGEERLHDRVRLTGYVDRETARLYFRAADACLLPYIEPALATSGSAAWALSSGRPVIASSIPAFKELADASGGLYLVSPNAPHELALGVLDLLSDVERVEQQTASARRWALKHGWESVAAAYGPLLGFGVTEPARLPLDMDETAAPAHS